MGSRSHPLLGEPDGRLADWWLQQLRPLGGGAGVPVGVLLPASFPAVCQVFHPWLLDAEGRWASWQNIAQEHGYSSVRELDGTRSEGFVLPLAHEVGAGPTEGELDQRTATTLVEILSDFTSRPDDVCVGIWDGWADPAPQRFPGAVRISKPGRDYFLLRGPLRGVLDSVASSKPRRPASGLWWPLERAWFVHTEIDFQWTFVAGSQELIDALVADPRLEVAPTRFDDAANEAHEPDVFPPDE